MDISKTKKSAKLETSKKKQRMKSGPMGRGYNVIDYIHKNKIEYTESVCGLKLSRTLRQKIGDFFKDVPFKCMPKGFGNFHGGVVWCSLCPC